MAAQLMLVNGSHTTLAFLTLCLRQPRENSKRQKNSEVSEYTKPGNHELINWDLESCGVELHKEIWIWAVARLLILLSEFDQDALMEAHKVDTLEELCEDLLAYTRETLNRFSSTVDTTGRVLGGGVANRYQGRLACVEEGVQQVYAKGMNKISLMLLEKAGLRPADIPKVLSRLCLDARRFTGLKPIAKKMVMAESV